MLPRILLLSAVLIWGWTFVATKILVTELGPVEILALRLALGIPFLGLVLWTKRVPLRFERADAAPLLLGGTILALPLSDPDRRDRDHDRQQYRVDHRHVAARPGCLVAGAAG